jgi:hypothetical protein
MAEKALECQQISSVPQELGGERLPQPMAMQVCPLGSLPEMVKELIQAVGCQRMAFSGKKQWLIWLGLLAGRQILPDDPSGGLAQVGDPILCTFPELHDHLPVATA